LIILREYFKKKRSCPFETAPYKLPVLVTIYL
jgi:hypothetical protein